ncbi:MAG: SHOCT domain-containing protein [Gammaproteobacteria bacterium]
MNDSFLGFGPGHWVLGILLWGIFIMLMIALNLGIKNKLKHGGKSQAGQKSALSILEERYARGEIDTTQFTEMKRKLET